MSYYPRTVTFSKRQISQSYTEISQGVKRELQQHWLVKLWSCDSS